MFTKEERSSFKYWFAHWCAFQMTAPNLIVLVGVIGMIVWHFISNFKKP